MENFEKIERYIQDKMNADERTAFEIEMNSNPEIEQEMNVIRDLILGVETYGLKQKLSGRKIGQEESTDDTIRVVEMPKKKASPLRYLAIAASFAAVLFCGYWMMQPSLSHEQKMLADAFYVDPGLPTPMSETNNYNFYDAMVDYKMGKYDVALEKWNKVTTGIGLDTLSYYKGIASLNADKSTKAIEELSAVPESSSFSDKAKWYTLSIYIKNGELDKAKSIINQLPPNINPKYEAIKSFLESE